jgi:hypothetical protein
MTPPPPVPADISAALENVTRRLFNLYLSQPLHALDVDLIEDTHNALTGLARFKASTRPSATRPLTPLAPSQPEGENLKL